MGAVFRAHQLAMDRRVAVKLIRPDLSADETLAARFRREAKGTFKIESEHAVKVLDFAITDDGQMYMVLEYLDGRTIGRELDVDGPLSPRRALSVARQLTMALAASHRVGLLHRDLKPDNIMLIRHGADEDFVKVLDFGLVKLIADSPDAALSAAALTQAGMIFGTPEYMSPEQAMGLVLTPASDIYAVGAIIYEMLVGQPPFFDEVAMRLLAHHVRTPAPHLAEVSPLLAQHAALPALDSLVQRCLAKDIASRPRDADELLALIDAAAQAVNASVGHAESSRTDTAPLVPRHRDANTTWLPRVAETETQPAIGKRRRAAFVPALIVAVIAALVLVLATLRGDPNARPAANVAPRVSALVAAAPTSPAVAPAKIAPPLVVAAPAHPVRPISPAAPVPAVPSELEVHLRAAEQARGAGNTLKQMAEADRALELDAHNVRAHFLIADALVASGDLPNACKQLQAILRYPPARDRFSGAGCAKTVATPPAD